MAALFTFDEPPSTADEPDEPAEANRYAAEAAAAALLARGDERQAERILMDPQELKAAYRKEAMRVHPDTGGSEEEFLKIKAARDVLEEFQRSLATP